MKKRIYLNNMLAIKSSDWNSLRFLAPIFLLAGIAYVASVISYQTLFASRFGVQYLPAVYVVEASILPFQMWLLNKLARRFSPANFVQALFAAITGLSVVLALLLMFIYWTDYVWLWFYPVLYISASILVRTLSPAVWILGDIVCPLQQAKRVFPLLGAFFSLGGALAGFLGRWLTASFPGQGTELLFLALPCTLLASTGLWRRTISRYSESSALVEDSTPMDRISTTINTILRSPLLRTVLLSMLIVCGLFFLIDFEFLVLSQAALPDTNDLTHYYSLNMTVDYIACLVIGLFVLNRLLDKLGISYTVISMAVTAIITFACCTLLASTPWGLTTAFWAIIITDILAFTLVPPICQVYYKLVPAQQRSGISLIFSGVLNAGGKLLGAAISALYSTGMVSMTMFSALGLVLAVILLVFSLRQKKHYFTSLMYSLKGHTTQMAEVTTAFWGKLFDREACRTVAEFLCSNHACTQELALEICEKIQSPYLIPYIMPLINHPNPRLRLGALKALPERGREKAALIRLYDPEPAIRRESISILSSFHSSGETIMPALRQAMYDQNSSVSCQALITLEILSDPESAVFRQQIIGEKLQAGGEDAADICPVVAAAKLKIWGAQVEHLLTDNNPRTRTAAVECLGRLGYVQAIPSILNKCSSADREFLNKAEQALLDMAPASLPFLTAALNDKRIAVWKLAVVTLASLDDRPSVIDRLASSCVHRLRLVNEAAVMPRTLHVMGQWGASQLARQRLNEIAEEVVSACWVALACSLDFTIINRIRDTIYHPDEEKRHRAMEILAELSVRNALAAELYNSLNPRDNIIYPNSKESCPDLLERSCSILPDPWLLNIKNYALAKWDNR